MAGVMRILELMAMGCIMFLRMLVQGATLFLRLVFWRKYRP